jgi:hypothetical protein
MIFLLVSALSVSIAAIACFALCSDIDQGWKIFIAIIALLIISSISIKTGG